MDIWGKNLPRTLNYTSGQTADNFFRTLTNKAWLRILRLQRRHLDIFWSFLLSRVSISRKLSRSFIMPWVRSLERGGKIYGMHVSCKPIPCPTDICVIVSDCSHVACLIQFYTIFTGLWSRPIGLVTFCISKHFSRDGNESISYILRCRLWNTLDVLKTRNLIIKYFWHIHFIGKITALSFTVRTQMHLLLPRVLWYNFFSCVWRPPPLTPVSFLSEPTIFVGMGANAFLFNKFNQWKWKVGKAENHTRIEKL